MLRKDKKITDVAINIAVFIVFVVVLSMSIRLQLKKNETVTQINKLTEQQTELQNYADELQATIDKPLDDEYIAEIARTKLGLRYSQEIIYYSDEIAE